MARTFNGTSDNIALALGAMGFRFNPGTVAMILRSSADGGAANRNVFYVGSTAAGTGNWELVLTTADALRLFTGTAGGVSAPTITFKTAEGFCLLAITKAAGTVKPRFHKYVYGTGIWTHEDSATTLANDGADPVTGCVVGSNPLRAGIFAGDIAVIGAWNITLTDSQIESLPFGFPAWLSPANPKGLWFLGQAGGSSVAATDAAYIDPTADGTNVAWAKSTGTAAWSLLDDATRQPTAPTTGSDRITGGTSAGALQDIVFPDTLTYDPTANYKLWVYGVPGNRTGWSTLISVNDSTFASEVSMAAAATPATAAGWFSRDISALVTSQAALNGLRVQFKTLTIAGTGATAPEIDAAYVVQIAPAHYSLNLPDLSGNGANQSGIAGTSEAAASVPVFTPFGTVTNP